MRVETASPRWPWMAYGLGDVVQQRRAHRPEPRRPHLQDADGAAPRRDARALRDGRVPPAEPARVLRPGVAALRQLRHLPRRHRDVRRPRAGAEAALDDRSAQARAQPVVRRGGTSSTSSGVPRPSASGSRGTTSSQRTASANDLSDQDWRSVVRQLLARGILVAQGDYGTLAPGEQAAGVLRGETAVPLRKDTIGRPDLFVAGAQGQCRRCAGCRGPRPVRGAARLAGRDRSGAGCAGVHRVRRRDPARARRAPAGFPRRPRRHITGIGAKKREAYGEGVLAVIAAA